MPIASEVSTLHLSVFRNECTFPSGTSGGALFQTGFVMITETSVVTNKAGEDGLAVFSLGGFNEPSNVSFQSNTRSCPFGEYGYDMKVGGRPVTVVVLCCVSCDVWLDRDFDTLFTAPKKYFISPWYLCGMNLLHVLPTCCSP